MMATPDAAPTDETPIDDHEQVAAVEPATEAVPDTSPPALSSRRRYAIIAGVVAVIAVLAAGGYWRYGRPKTTAVVVATTTPRASVSPAAAADPLLERLAHPTTGETWLATPQKLSDLKLLKDAENPEYYKVGMHGDAEILMSVYATVGESINLYERTAAGKVTAILHPDAQAVYNTDNDRYAGDEFSAKVAIDRTIHYDSLTVPARLPLAHDEFVTRPTYPNLGMLIRSVDSTSKSTIDKQITKYGSNTLVRRETVYVDTKLTSITYVLSSAAHTLIGLGYKPYDTELKNYQWERGTNTSDEISPMTYGCGSLTTAVTRADGLTAADVQSVGKAPDGTTVYELKSVDHPLMTKAYEEFNDFYKNSTPSENQYIGITKAKFATEHAVIIIRDKSDQWLVYARDQLRPAGGCAKPVIYLYPQHTQAVSVRVGADVKVSLPTYDPKSGWQVVASPSGRLQIGNDTYDSLYWEGPGIGRYPGITAGTIVPRSQAVTTIRRQLAEQGLVQHEINDFMAYWEPKLPTKPYVRLTWFDTAELNELAPLAISPRPDTLIRVFLDASGLDQPIALPAQRFKPLPRSGFTVVEWGGLANFPLK